MRMIITAIVIAESAILNTGLKNIVSPNAIFDNREIKHINYFSREKEARSHRFREERWPPFRNFR